MHRPDGGRHDGDDASRHLYHLAAPLPTLEVMRGKHRSKGTAKQFIVGALVAVILAAAAAASFAALGWFSWQRALAAFAVLAVGLTIIAFVASRRDRAQGSALIDLALVVLVFATFTGATWGTPKFATALPVGLTTGSAVYLLDRLLSWRNAKRPPVPNPAARHAAEAENST